MGRVCHGPSLLWAEMSSYRSVAGIFHMFLCHIEQGLRTQERNISETGVFKALVPWSICLPKTVFRKMKTCYCYCFCPVCSVGKTKVGSRQIQVN